MSCDKRSTAICYTFTARFETTALEMLDLLCRNRRNVFVFLSLLIAALDQRIRPCRGLMSLALKSREPGGGYSFSDDMERI